MLRPLALVGVSSLVFAACNSPTANDQLRSLLASSARCERPPVGAAPAGRGHPALTGHTTMPLAGMPFAVAVSAKGVVYVTQGLAGSAVRADLPSTMLSTSFAVGDLPSQVRIHPNGKTAYVCNQDSHTVTLVDVATNQAVAAIPVPAGSILTLGLSPEGDRLYALTDYFGIYVINTDTRQVIDSIPGSATGRLLTGVAFHPFAPCMYIAARDEGTIRTVDLRDDSVVHTDTVAGGRIQNVAVSLDGGQLFATDIQRSKLLVRDLKTEDSDFLEYAIGSGRIRTPFAVAVSPAGVVYVTQSYAASAVRADLPSTTFSAPFPVGYLPSQVRMSPDGRTAYVSNQDDGTVTFINVATNRTFGTATVPG